MNDKPTDRLARPCNLPRRIVARWLLQLEQSEHPANYIIILFSDGTVTIEDTFAWGTLHDCEFQTWRDRWFFYEHFLEARGDGTNELLSRYTRSVDLRPRTKHLMLRAARRGVTLMCSGEAFSGPDGCRCVFHDPLAIAINQDLENRYFWPLWSKFIILVPDKRRNEFVRLTPPPSPMPATAFNLTSLPSKDKPRF